MRLAFLFLVLQLATTVGAAGQDYTGQYASGKALFEAKSYDFAMRAFEPLIAPAPSNVYTRCAAFYYAVSAYALRIPATAKSIFLQLREAYPQWSQHQEVDYWLARIYFDEGEYFMAMKALEGCKNEDLREDVAQLKGYYLARIQDVETARLLFDEHSNDRLVGERLLSLIAEETNTEEYGRLARSIRTKFDLPSEGTATIRPVFKDRYNVALFFPFLASALRATLTPQVNQSAIDLYRGMAMGCDSLRKKGVHVDLELYDTRRDPAITTALLRDGHVGFFDALVGPLFFDQLSPIQRFSKANHIPVINPTSGNPAFVEGNPHALLYLPDHATVGRRSAEWLHRHASAKKCVVFLERNAKNMAIFDGFSHRAAELGLSLTTSMISREDAYQAFAFLTDPAVLDDNGVVVELKQPLNSIGSVFVVSEDPLIYTKVISGIDARGDAILLLGHQSWLQNKMTSLDTYERLRIVMAAPEFFAPASSASLAFDWAFALRYGVSPNDYARTGYEFMCFLGQCFRQYGAHFLDALKRQGVVKGCLSPGYDYKDSQSNQLVPFISLQHGAPTIAY